MSLLKKTGAATLNAAFDYLRTFTDYEQSLPTDALRTFDLGRVRTLLGRLSNPHLGRRSLHVTGTKGKGSVVMFADAILVAHGVRTFRFVSPHVEKLNERIAVDGQDVTDDVLAGAIFSLVPAIEAMREAAPADLPTFFEVLTATGFVIARDRGVDADVVEVGMGGRLDATNVIDPTVTVITSIDLDHTRILGRTRDKIAAEKAGIVKPGKPLLFGLREGDPGFEVIRARARELGAPASWIGAGISVKATDFALTAHGRPGVRFDGSIEGLDVRGAVAPGGAFHQAANALLALGAAAKVLRDLGRPLDLRKALDAIETTTLPARAELFGTRVQALLDGAHTGASAAALVSLVRWLFAGKRLVLVAGLMRERSVKSLFSPFLKVVERAVFTRIPSPRAADPAEAAAAWKALGGSALAADHPEEALALALDAAREGGAVVVAGSFYLAGALRPALRNLV